MPRDKHMHIRICTELPTDPRIEALSDSTFRVLLVAMFGAVGGSVDIELFSRRARDELRHAGVMAPTGHLLIHQDLFQGPYRDGSARTKIPAGVRKAVYERDDYRCVSCGADRPLSLDHIYPWSLGGEDTMENLQTMCLPCNCHKGATV